MIDCVAWTPVFLHALDETFGPRVWFVGMQGSYSRGEATEHSDLDMVVILDEVKAEDIRAYRAMLDQLSERPLLCGFFSGKQELMNWEPSDLFQFYYDTQPIRGSLDELLHLLDDAAVRRAVRIGACNVYHGCVHNMLYEQSSEMVAGLYKAASFVIQAIAFRQTGRYIRRLKDLPQVLAPDEAEIITTFMTLKNGGKVDFAPMSERLFAWAKKLLAEDEYIA